MDISRQILAALKNELRDAAIDRNVLRSTGDLEAQDTLRRGWAHFQRGTREGMLEARYLFERSIEQDPDSALACARAGWTYVFEYTYGWNLDRTLLDRAEELALRALALDPSLSAPHQLSARLHLIRGQIEEAAAAAERSVELAPNQEFPYGGLALVRARQGRFVAAMQSADRMLRLNSSMPSGAFTIIAFVNFSAGRTERAVELWQLTRATNPDMILARIPLAVLYETEGRHEDASALAQEILRVNRDLTAESATEMAKVFGFDREGAIDLLRSAGIP